MTAKKLYIFVGYPGAGKTTVSRLIAKRTGAVHLWADQERQAMFGRAKLSEAETAKLYDQLNTETEHLLGEGKSVIFDTNFNFRKDREHMRQLAAKHAAKRVLIWLKTPLEISQERATRSTNAHGTRVWGNMSQADFEHISKRLEPPATDERAIMIDGTRLDEQTVISRLGL